MKNRYMKENMIVDAEYKSISQMVSELQGMGYLLEGVKTRGEHSYHDGIYSFDKYYPSLQEFLDWAVEDYLKEEKKFSAYLSWDMTVFTLRHQSCTVMLYTFHKDMATQDPTEASFLMRASDSASEKDELLQKTVSVLRKYKK